MQTVKTFLWGPDPEQQKQKCNTLVRQNCRKLDRDMAGLSQLDHKTRTLITQAAARAKKSPNGSAAAKACRAEARLYARELVRVRRQSRRLNTSKATLQSVGMQVNNAFAMRRIQGEIAASTKVMRDVNALVRLPELTGAMRELSAELMKAGIIEEMVDDVFVDPAEELGEDDEAEAEVDRVLAEVLKDKMAAGSLAVGPELEASTAERVQPVAVEEDDEDQQEAIMAQMRGRLEALKS